VHYKFFYFMQPETSLPLPQKPATWLPTINTKYDTSMSVSPENEQVWLSSVTIAQCPIRSTNICLYRLYNF
jgi:hypothetical protein